MTIEEVDRIIELRKQIKSYSNEAERINGIISDYAKGVQSFEGIRLYSRLHSSIELSNDFVTMDEILEIYITRLGAKIGELEAELADLISPPVVNAPVKKRKLW